MTKECEWHLVRPRKTEKSGEIEEKYIHIAFLLISSQAYSPRETTPAEYGITNSRAEPLLIVKYNVSARRRFYVNTVRRQNPTICGWRSNLCCRLQAVTALTIPVVYCRTSVHLKLPSVPAEVYGSNRSSTSFLWLRSVGGCTL